MLQRFVIKRRKRQQDETTSETAVGPAAAKKGTMAQAATAPQEQDDIWRVPVDKALDRLQELNINLLALDFDQTIMGIHTGGNWKETAETLIPHVRPMFRTIVPSALDRGLYVAVVTFSTQVDMVRSVLEAIVGQERAQSIPIRGGGSGVVGGNGSMAMKDAWIYHGQGSHGGKQAHMASAVEELEQRHDGLEIHKTTTVLIDDDGKNIRTALKQGVRAVWLNPRRPGQILKDLVELI